MQISKAGIELIKRFEGLRLQSYQDEVGVWTIGYGSTRGIKPGQKITERQALEVLKNDLIPAEVAVNRFTKVPLTQNRYDALVSLVFNIGEGAFERSTLLRVLNAGQYEEAQKQFLRWIYAGKKVSEGLKIRRAIESKVFGTP